MLGRALRRVRQNLVAYLALFFAIGGTAMAAKPLITGADVADDSLTGADVDEATLSPVPSAVYAQNAGNAENAQDAANAVNASFFDNQPPSAFAPSAVEPFHNVGDPGEPEFLNGWTNYRNGYDVASFYKDPWGVVHLRGVVFKPDATGSSTIFVLPEGYKPHPDDLAFFYVNVTVQAYGAVNSFGNVQVVSLDGLTFRPVP